MNLNLQNQNVNLNGLHQNMVLAIYWVMTVFKKHGTNYLTISSVDEGKNHEIDHDSVGRVLEIDLEGMQNTQKIVAEVREILPPIFKVVKGFNSLTVRYDPKMEK